MNKIGDACYYEKNTQDFGEVAGFDCEETEGQKPKPPERRDNTMSTAAQPEKTKRESIQLRFSERRQRVGTAQEY